MVIDGYHGNFFTSVTTHSTLTWETGSLIVRQISENTMATQHGVPVTGRRDTSAVMNMFCCRPMRRHGAWWSLKQGESNSVLILILVISLLACRPNRLYVWLSACLPTCLSIYLFACLWICIFVSLSVCQSKYTLRVAKNPSIEMFKWPMKM